MEKPMLMMDNMSKSFPGVKALDNVNFTVYEEIYHEKIVYPIISISIEYVFSSMWWC